MIRNVVLMRLPADATEAQRATLERGLAGIAALRPPGLLACHAGRDAGLREGGWDAAITNDFADAEAYRAYDVEAEHNRYRSMIVEVCEDVARVQLELP